MLPNKDARTDLMAQVSLDSQWDQVLATEVGEPAGGEQPNQPLQRISVRCWPMVISLLVVVGAGTAGRVWYRHQVRKQSAVFLQRALEAQDKNDWTAAADWLSQYIQYVPDDAARVRQLASQVLAHASTRDECDRALRLYRAYLDLRPDDEEARTQIAKILLVFNPQQALQQAGKLLAVDPGNLVALRIRAVAMDRLYTLDGSNEGGKLVRVVEAYEDLLKQSPGDDENALRLARLYRLHADALAEGMGLSDSQVAARADAPMDRLIEAKPRDVAARLARFQYRSQYEAMPPDQDNTQLDEDLRVALQIAPDDAAVLFAAGAYYARSEPGDLIQRDRLELARKYLRRVVEQRPKASDPYLLLGRVTWTLGNRDEAVAAIEMGLQQDTDNLALLVTLGDFEIQRQQWAQARATMDQLAGVITKRRRIVVSPGDHWELNLRQAELSVLRARWYLHPENPDRDSAEAERIVRRVVHDPIPLNIPSKVFQDLGVLCARLGLWDDATVALKNATVAAPRAVSPRLQLVTALQRVGRFQEAADECRQLTDRELLPQYAATVWMEYTRLLLELQLSKPREDRLWDDFDKALVQLKRTRGNDPEVALLELDAEQIRRGPASGATVASTLRSMEPKFRDSPAFWRGALSFYLRLDLASDARRAVTKLEDLAANVAIPAGNQEATATQDGPSSPVGTKPRGPEDRESDDQPRHHVVTAAKQFDEQFRLAVNEKRYADAFGILQQWSTELPSSVRPRLETQKLVSRLVGLGDFQPLQQGLKAVEGPGGTLWRLARTQWLLKQAQSGDPQALNKVVDFVTAWVASEPDQMTARLALGMVNEARGQLDDAIRAYRLVFDRGQRRLELTTRLTRLLVLAGRLDEAEQTMRHLTSRQRLSPLLLPLVVHVEIQKGDVGQAVQDARRAVDLAPSNAEAQVWLGRALLTRGQENDLPRAEKALARAVALAPADVSVLVAAIHFQLRAQRAIQTCPLELYVRRAAALIEAHDCPLSAWQSLVVARCLQLEGAWRVAETFYRKALDADPAATISRSLPAGAIVTLNAAKVETELTDPVVWATGRSTYQTLGLLMGVVSPPTQDALLNLLDNDPRLLATVALGRAEPGSVRTALGQLARLPAGRVTASDHMLMGDLLRREGRRAESRKHDRAALGSELSDMELWRIADAALQSGATDDAQQAIDQLERRGTAGVAELVLRIRLLAAQKKTGPMFRLASDAVRQVSSLQQRITWGRAAADALSRVGYPEQARVVLQSACRRYPHRDLVLANWLATQPDQVDEAMQMCTEIAKNGTSQQAASLAVLCRQQSSLPPRMTEQAEAIIQKALDQTPSLQLLVNLSRLRELQGRIGRAIALVKRAEKLHGGNAVLSNSMAWYLGVYRGQHEQALTLVNQAIRALGPLDPLLDTKGVILLQAGDYQHAIRLLETATLSAEPAATTYLHLAAAYLADRRLTEARQALQNARQLGLEAVAPFDVKLIQEVKAELADQ